MIRGHIVGSTPWSDRNLASIPAICMDGNQYFTWAHLVLWGIQLVLRGRRMGP